MFSFKKFSHKQLKQLMINIVAVCCLAWSASLVAQTQSANLKSPEPATVGAAKSADIAKPADPVPSGYIVGDSDVLHVNVWRSGKLPRPWWFVPMAISHCL